MSPRKAVAAFKKLGAVENRRHSRKNYSWLEVLDADGHQIAIFNVPVAKKEIPRGTLVRGILNPNGIRDENHLVELTKSDDPPTAFRAVLAARGPMTTRRPAGQ